MGDTNYFGFTKFGAEGRISDGNYKFSLRDRETMDSLLWTLYAHDHRATSTSEGITGPTNLNLAQTDTGGTLPPGVTFYYKVSFLDATGNETAAGYAANITTPSALRPPALPALSVASTGGALETGLYRYALSYYQTGIGETRATNYGTINVATGTSTNEITLTLETPPNDADGWKVYRKGPLDNDFYYLATVAATATPPTSWDDDGSVLADCTKYRPTANTTNSANKVTVTLHDDDLPLDSRVTSWRVYRTSTAGIFGGSSLLQTVVETTTEGGTDLVTSYVDTGSGTVTGSPLAATTTPPSIPQIDASDSFDLDGGRLPAVLAPLAVNQFHTLCPGTLAAQTYNQFYIPEDMPIERIDGYFLTAPTGLSGSNYLTLRVKDDATQNEIQSVWNNAVDVDEVQYVYNNATGGTFTLSDGTDTTDPLDYDSLASTIANRLETDIDAITTVDVSGLGTASNPWVIIFSDPGGAPFGALTAGDGSLTGGVSTVQVATAGKSAGTFTLTYSGQTTGNIAYDAPGPPLATPDSSSVEEKLEALSNITAVTVTGDGTEEDPWLVEFVNPGSQNVDMMTASNANLNGTVYIDQETKGYSATQVDMVIDANQAYHYFQTPLTDGETQEAEDSPATGGTEISDALALNDVAMELDTQNETNSWNLGTLDAGDYIFKFWVTVDEADTEYDLLLNDLNASNLETLSIADDRLQYTPAYEIYYTADGTEDFEVEVEKTDAGTGVVRVDRYSYEADLPTLHQGGTGTIEVLVTGSPTTNGDDLQVNVWY